MKGQSEWHEQIEYSELYFAETRKCREAQMTNEPEIWALALESKIAFAAGILDKETVEGMNAKIDLALKNLEGAKSAMGITLTSLWKKQTNKMIEAYNYALIKTLREVERECDTKVNKVMPFLNIRKKVDLTKW